MGLDDDLAAVRAAVDRVDGLVPQAGLHTALGATRQRAHQLMRRDGFPAPVSEAGGTPLWAVRELFEWNRRRLSS